MKCKCIKKKICFECTSDRLANILKSYDWFEIEGKDAWRETSKAILSKLVKR